MKGATRRNGQGFGHNGMYTSRLVADKIIFYEQIGGE